MLDLLGGFAEHQRRRNLASSTITTRRRTLQQFARWLEPDPLYAATPGDIEGWLDSLALGPRSRYLYLSSLTAFFDWTGEPEPNPARKVDRPKLPKLLPRPLADGDLSRALRMAEPRMALWLTLAAFQGFRCHEIAHMRREDVLDTNVPPLVVVSKGKGDRQRIMPAHAATLAALDAYGYRMYRGWLFPSRTGNHYHPATVSHYIWAHLNRCNGGGSAHRGRHWFGTHFYRASRDLRLTQEMMGHADPRTTAIYTQFDPADASAAMGRLHLE